jgi:hypothetical protein
MGSRVIANIRTPEIGARLTLMFKLIRIDAQTEADFFDSTSVECLSSVTPPAKHGDELLGAHALLHRIHSAHPPEHVVRAVLPLRQLPYVVVRGELSGTLELTCYNCATHEWVDLCSMGDNHMQLTSS